MTRSDQNSTIYNEVNDTKSKWCSFFIFFSMFGCDGSCDHGQGEPVLNVVGAARQDSGSLEVGEGWKGEPVWHGQLCHSHVRLVKVWVIKLQ